jgi:hypothetical protein
MTKARMGIRVADDRETVVVEIAPVGETSYPVELTLEQLDKLMGHLGEARRKMVEGKPSPKLDQLTIRTAAYTTWAIEASPPDGALLAFYHPSYGPVGFSMPRETIVEMVNFLTDRFILQPTASAKQH